MSNLYDSAPLREQLEYYRARAGEYDAWWHRTGRYDRGPEANAAWFAEQAETIAALDAFRPTGRVLELACGTGLWTERLAKYADSLTAVDGSPEMLALNAARLKAVVAERGPAEPVRGRDATAPAPSKRERAQVKYVEADLFAWRPAERFDVVFFSFWLSHVPPERFAEFWRLVEACLAPGGRVFVLDSLHDAGSTAADHRLPPPTETTLLRQLDDGREFRIVKVFYDPRGLAEQLATLGWTAEVRRTGRYFLYADVRRAER